MLRFLHLLYLVPGRYSMKCPYCGHLNDKVLHSRSVKDGEAMRRRRECLACGRRFTTFEQIEELPVMVIKKDGRREPFDRSKILRGMIVACEKRSVPIATLEAEADDIERAVYDHRLQRSGVEPYRRDGGGCASEC